MGQGGAGGLSLRKSASDLRCGDGLGVGAGAGAFMPEKKVVWVGTLCEPGYVHSYVYFNVSMYHIIALVRPRAYRLVRIQSIKSLLWVSLQTPARASCFGLS